MSDIINIDFHLSFPAGDTVRNLIYDLSGRTVYTAIIDDPGYVSLDRNNLNPGILILELIDNKGNIYNKKISVL